MPSWMEFHDSWLESAELGADGAFLLLKAYVHRWEQVDGIWKGTGWSQPISVTIGPPAIGDETTEELGLYGGCLTIDSRVHNNWLPLPFSAEGQVALRFDLTEGGIIEFMGRNVRVEAVGEATYVENLPDDMKPDEID
jgi:hypothetical protein